MTRACLTCGRPFQPQHLRHRRCAEHQAGDDQRQVHYRSPEWTRRPRGACAYCGSTDRVALHHLTALADGGRDDDTLALCVVHHGQLEADKRNDRDTPLRRWVDAMGGGSKRPRERYPQGSRWLAARKTAVKRT